MRILGDLSCGQRTLCRLLCTHHVLQRPALKHAVPWLTRIAFHTYAGILVQCRLTFSSFAVRMFEAFLGFPFSNVFPVSSLPTCACTRLPVLHFLADSSDNAQSEDIMS